MQKIYCQLCPWETKSFYFIFCVTENFCLYFFIIFEHKLINITVNYADGNLKFNHKSTIIGFDFAKAFGAILLTIKIKLEFP